VTRCALDHEWDVLGVRQGYVGLIDGHFTALNVRAVGGIIQQGGTVLGSTRCLEFTTPEGRTKALTQIQRHSIDSVVVIGGDGSQKGAAALSQMGIAVVGFDLRTTTVGHVQRGGQPTASDRLLATRLGAGAVDALARGERGVLVGLLSGHVATTPFAEIVGDQKPLSPELIRLAGVLARSAGF
jgi:6-phosphofructokinase